jgi:lysyl-tRNA synthetase class 2
MSMSEFVGLYGSSIQDGERKEDITVSLAGRLTSVREQGKLIFFDLSGDGTKVQLMSDSKSFAAGEEEWAKIVYLLRRGDVVIKGGLLWLPSSNYFLHVHYHALFLALCWAMPNFHRVKFSFLFLSSSPCLHFFLLCICLPVLT